MVKCPRRLCLDHFAESRRFENIQIRIIKCISLGRLEGEERGREGVWALNAGAQLGPRQVSSGPCASWSHKPNEGSPVLASASK